MGFKAVAKHAPVIHSWHFLTPADQPVFVADRSYEVQEVIEVHSASAASATVQVRVCNSGTAPASGTALFGTAFAADSTTNTPVFKNLSNGGIVSRTVATVSRGQTLAVDVTGTLTGYQGSLTIVLKPIGNPLG